HTVQFTDLTRFHEGLKGFSGCAAAGDSLIFAPLMNSKGHFHGLVTRFDPRHPPGSPASAEYLDLTRWFPGARGFAGIVPAGPCLYLIPYHHDTHHGTIVRYDTRLPFRDRDAWAALDLQAVIHPDACGFVSGSSDG